MSGKTRDVSPVNSPVERRKKGGSAISRLNPHGLLRQDSAPTSHDGEKKEAERRTSPLREQDISPTNTQILASSSGKRPAIRAEFLDKGESASDPLPRSESESRVRGR